MAVSPVSILYIAYDKDKDIWPITNALFQRFWPNCPFSVVFVSVNEANICPRFLNVATAGKAMISDRILCGLSQIDSPYVLMLLGDHVLSGAPRMQDFDRFIRFLDSSKADYCQLGSHLVKNLKGKKTTYKGFKEIPHHRKYRISMQPALWKTSFLKQVASHPIDSSWEFETFFIDDINGRTMADSAGAYFADHYQFPICNLLDKGAVAYPAVELLLSNNLAMLSGRRVQNKTQYRKVRIKDYFYYHSPNWLISLLKKVFHHKGYSK